MPWIQSRGSARSFPSRVSAPGPAGSTASLSAWLACGCHSTAELTLQQTVLEVLTGLGGLAVVVTGAWLAGSGAIDPGILPLLTLLAMSAFLPISEIAQISRQLADTLGSTRRYYALENEPVRITDGAGTQDVVTGAPGLVFDRVSFAYPGQARRALSDVSFTIAGGSTVALVGTSGAGKTNIRALADAVLGPG